MAPTDAKATTLPEVFVTKYAMTQGILRVKDMRRADSDDQYVTKNFMFVRLGRDAFLTLAEAEADAQARIKAKIASNEKAIKKLRSLKPKVVDWEG